MENLKKILWREAGKFISPVARESEGVRTENVESAVPVIKINDIQSEVGTVRHEDIPHAKANSGNRLKIIFSGVLAVSSLFLSWRIGFIFRLDGAQLGIILPMILTFAYPVRRAWVRGRISPFIGKTISLVGLLLSVLVLTGLASHKVFLFQKNAIGPGALMYFGATVLLANGVWGYCRVQPKVEPWYRKVLRFLLAGKSITAMVACVVITVIYAQMRVLTVAPSVAASEGYSVLQYFPERSNFFEVRKAACPEVAASSYENCLSHKPSIDGGREVGVFRFPYSEFLHSFSVPIE